MVQRVVTVGSASGLHARPARLFVKAAAALPVTVTLTVAGKRPAKAASMLGVLALGAVQGTEVTLSADDGDGAAGQDAVGRLAALLATDLDAVDDAAVEAVVADAVAPDA
jgi:phosphocarrier protein HPr